jgi:hypothetical protein
MRPLTPFTENAKQYGNPDVSLLITTKEKQAATLTPQMGLITGLIEDMWRRALGEIASAS